VLWVRALARWDFLKDHAKVAVGTQLRAGNGKTSEYAFKAGPIYAENFSNQSNKDFISAGWAIDFDRYLLHEFVPWGIFGASVVGIHANNKLQG
jgi:hypothetical protein